MLHLANDKMLVTFITTTLQQAFRGDKAHTFFRVCMEIAVESALDKSSLVGLGIVKVYNIL